MALSEAAFSLACLYVTEHGGHAELSTPVSGLSLSHSLSVSLSALLSLSRSLSLSVHVCMCVSHQLCGS